MGGFLSLLPFALNPSSTRAIAAGRRAGASPIGKFAIVPNFLKIPGFTHAPVSAILLPNEYKSKDPGGPSRHPSPA